MNDDEYKINEGIALALGWRMDPSGPSDWLDPEGNWDKPGLPIWTQSKDLMLMEKRKMFLAGTLELYKSALGFVALRDAMNQSNAFDVHLASAIQEAEAYLMTLEGLKKL